ncbi:CRISPR-associated protein, Csm4 family [Campylobacterota bacterium]|nr:CRISPR-associated protein, Csm4 family [Campylobacterota bacterium]
MKLLKTTITPRSNFATPLKGDTLFGQLCWAVVFAFGEERLKKLLATYTQKPFLVVSDAFQKGFLPKPTLPLSFFNACDPNGEVDKKEERKKKWIALNDLQNGALHKAENPEKFESEKPHSIMHNSIDRRTFKTGEDGFAPYATTEFLPSEKEIYCLIDSDQLNANELNAVFASFRDSGFGKDTTIGKGRFEFLQFQEASFGGYKNAVMALSPFSPQHIDCKKIYYDPFTRFGKKGASRAHQNPFKKPLLLADTGAVICFDQPYEKPFIGQAITGHSSHNDIVHQGYAIALPITLPKGII